MSYWIQETSGNHNMSGYRLFYCDAETDIKNLPTATKEGKVQDGDTVSCQKCAYGSEAFCIGVSKAYVLSKDTDTWTEV